MIPVIPIADILAGNADAALVEGGKQSGFLTISGVDAALGLAQARAGLLGFFAQDEAGRGQMLRHKYDPSRSNVYRGYFPCEPEKGALIEGVDIGPDVTDPARCGDGSDPLTEPTPMPSLPGWRTAAATYYTAMEGLGRALVAGLLRGLGADPEPGVRLFDGSISTLRMLHYPQRPAGSMPDDRRIETPAGQRWIMTGSHTDSGFVTLLWQDGTGGLQAQGPDGGWIDVPPAEGGLVVNFGQMLGEWTGGRIKATPHRVLGGTAERYSVPFFFEPAVDAVVAPLFPENQGETFVYGDFLWSRMTKFTNFHGVVRQPAGVA
ncbi:MAG TPA: 2OG-Fe(II) oxygenase family protein [Thermohalobaculum sp.]|nr:2OG-Fe(II) oxygenase family protein [Thermohalobaculum sp.]